MRFNQRFAPLVVLFVAFVVRIANLIGESLWRDEVDSVRFAFEPLGNILRNFGDSGFNGPLYHLMLRGWLSLAGVNDFALRYLSLVCSVLLVALVYVLTKRLFGYRAALVAMWLIALSPVLIWYAGEGKMYSLQPMLLTLALYALVRACANKKDCGLETGLSFQSPISNLPSPVWWFVFIIAASLSFYVHLLSPIFLAVAAVFFVAMWPQSRAHLKGGLIALALLTLPYAPLAFSRIGSVITGGDVGHTFYPLDVVARTLLSNWTVGLDGRAPLLDMPMTSTTVDLARWLVLALFVALALYALLSTDHEPPLVTRLKWATLAWLGLPMLIVFAVSLRFPVFQPRYLLWSAPALYVLAGAGFAHAFGAGLLGRRATQIAVTLLTLISVSGWVSQVIHPIRPDLRGASHAIVQSMRPGDAVVFQIPYGRYSFEYYARQAGVDLTQMKIVEAPYTNYGMAEDDVSTTMANALGNTRRVWLFETEATMWDARGLVHTWADRDLRLIERHDLRGVSVGLYQLP